MVMEAPPSPQSVGREFVRQYYTLLNKAPNHLHRFYNHQSSFVHGGLDPPNRETAPVVGQKQIHQKIQQLNFQDCHAKITQVDSQSTLGSGVVVQVTGELSNGGQPMRRFTQTFVLASQSPKKYYVHNDIFRYQDEIISDEECDTDGRSEPEDEPQTQPAVSDRPPVDVQQPLVGTQPSPTGAAPILPTYYGSTAPPAVAPVPPPAQLAPHHQPIQAAAAPTSHHQPPPHIMAQAPPQQPPQSMPTSALNGHPEDMGILQGQPLPAHMAPTTVQPHNLAGPIPQVIPQQEYSGQPPMNPSIAVEEQIQDNEEILEEPLDEGYGDAGDVEPDQDIQVEPTSNEPKTYANLLKSASAGSQQQSNYQQQPSYGSQSPPNVGIGPRPSTGTTNGANRMGPPRPGQQQSRGPPQSGRGLGGRNSIQEDDDRRRSQNPHYATQSDAHQLFLGNLPHAATEEELRDIFSEFGTVVDLRVHTKPGPGGQKPGQIGRAPPHYGFITYESQQSVQMCLTAKPIYYPKKDTSGIVLNVEEKKNSKDRQSYGGSGGGRIGNDNNRTGGRPDGVGQRRPMGGPGGMNRGGGVGSQGPNNRNQGGYNRGGGPPNRGGQHTYNRR
ncbi:ras GTPase-activating protein-binding protein 2 [Cylas formicarius]|uniref:ras GTPase-activating protein-binding protein 2 n=1 Tax=Cylas formicarius TaxID=197179 RepID=UPI0029586C2E|nr:ras GTPase-activating protein-binding protein 2 [Cylas formicarius]